MITVKLRVSCVTTVLLALGCRASSTPVWLPDSSAVIVAGCCYDVRTGEQRDVLPPDADTQRSHHISTLPERGLTAQSTFAFAADGIHFQFRVYDLKGSQQHKSVEFVMPWSKFPLVLRECAVPDVMWGPKGDRLLLCVYGYKDIPCASYSLTTRELKYYDQLVGPFCFEACLGLSPCRSDNAGFLAARKDLKTDEYLLGPLPSTDIVFATWDGQIVELETDAESELSEDELLHAVIGSQVPFEARWSGNVAVLSSCDAEVRIDTGKGTMSFRRLGPTTSPAMHTGRRVLQSRTLAGGKATVQIVEDRVSGRYRIVVQKDNGPQETLDAGLMLKEPTPSLLCTSPDNRYVVVTCFTPDRTFHLLINERGLVVKVLGDTGSNWRWGFAARAYGVVVGSYPVFNRAGDRHPRELQTVTLSHGDIGASLAFMASADGDLAKLRKVQRIEIRPEGNDSASDDDLSCLGAFRQLEVLSICGYSDASLRHLQAVPSLQVLNLGYGFTDEALRHLEGHQGIRSLSINASISGFGLRSLAKVPNLESLYLSIGATVTIDPQHLTELANITRLTTVELEGVDDATLDYLTPLVKLQTLIISGHIRGHGLACLDRMQALKRLRMEGEMSDDHLIHMAPLTSLEELTVRSPNISRIGLQYLSSLPTA